MTLNWSVDDILGRNRNSSPKLLPIPKTDSKEIAQTIAELSEKRVITIQAELNTHKNKLALERKKLAEARKKIEEAKREQKYLEQKHSILTMSKDELINYYTQTIDKLKQTELVQNLQVDKHQRVIITTSVLSVQKPEWPQPLEAGQYQIRIDFSTRDIDEGIKVLNISKAFDNYQSPTIDGLDCCWGNIREDIKDVFLSNNLYELVLDMIDYIISPNVSNGYIQLPGKGKETGWERFFRGSQERPKGYCFEEYYKDHPDEEKPIEETPEDTSDNQLTMSDGSTIHISNEVARQARITEADFRYYITANLASATATTTPNTTYATELYSQEYNARWEYERRYLAEGEGRFQSAYQRDVYEALQQIGLTEEAARYYVVRIAPMPGDCWDQFSIVRSGTGNDIKLLMEGETVSSRLQHMRSIHDAYLTVGISERIRKIISLNDHDLRSTTQQDQASRHVRIYAGTYDREIYQYTQRHSFGGGGGAEGSNGWGGSGGSGGSHP